LGIFLIKHDSVDVQQGNFYFYRNYAGRNLML